MKKITMFKIDGCPYCAQAFAAIKELKNNPDYAGVEIEVVDNYSDAAKNFKDKYYYVPSMFIDGKKFYEAHPDETYGECLLNVKKVFQAAI